MTTVQSTERTSGNGRAALHTPSDTNTFKVDGIEAPPPKLGAASETVTIAAPRFRVAEFSIIGTAPLVINRFPRGIGEQIRATQEAGSQSNSKKKREPKDFDKVFQNARYISTEGWDGIHASAFRLAMIGACRTVNFKMTLAKLGVFTEPDGFDKIDGTPLVRIIGNPPIMDVRQARNANKSVDLRARPMWTEWKMKVRIRFDLDMFSITDIANLMARVGGQCGIGEGRPSSSMSAGMGWGLFRVES